MRSVHRERLCIAQSSRYTLTLAALLYGVFSALLGAGNDAGAKAPSNPSSSGRATGSPAAYQPLHAAPSKRRWVHDYLVLTVELKRGALSIRSLRHGRYVKRTPVLSYWGPFRVLLYAGTKLHDSLRFSLPLTLPAGEPSPWNSRLDEGLGGNVNTTGYVVVPYDPALTHLVLVDRQGRHGPPWHIAIAPARIKPA